MLISPFIREFIGITVLILIFNELFIRKKIEKHLFILLIFFLHSIYPTLIISFFYGTPIFSIFEIGNLSSQIPKDKFIDFNFLLDLKMEILIYLFISAPLIIYTIFIIEVFRKKIFYVVLSFLFIFYLVVARGTDFFSPFIDNKVVSFLIILWLFIFFYKLKDSINFVDRKFLFLSFWLILTLIPFLKVFSSPIHLAYAFQPFLIITFLFILNIYKNNSNFRGFLNLLLIFGLLDQALVVYNSKKMTTAIYDNIKVISQQIKSIIPRTNSIILSNALHVEDIRYYSKNYFTSFWTVNKGVPNDRILSDYRKLKQFLDRDEREKYLLDIKHNYKVHKGNFHSNKIITRKLLELSNEIELKELSLNLYFVDPLKNFLSNKFHIFLGPPDLENDFYYGFVKNKSNMLKLHSEYSLYKIISPQISENLKFYSNNSFYFPKCFINIKKTKKECGYKNFFFYIPLNSIEPKKETFYEYVNNHNIKLYTDFKTFIFNDKE